MAQIGTINVETPSGTVALPVFATGDSGSSVIEAWKVQTAGGTGFVPLTSPTDATYPAIKVQAAGGVQAVHDSATVSTSVTIVDDFEDQDITEYAGDTGNCTVVSSPVQNGSYALEASTGSDTTVIISSTTGLNAYPSQGDTFRVWVRTSTANALHAVMFGTQSESASTNRYQTGLNQHQGEFELAKADSNGFTELAAATQSYSDDTWYEIEVAWGTDDSITATLYDSAGSQLNQVSATDATFTSGGVGFLHNPGTGGSTTNYDYWRIV